MERKSLNKLAKGPKKFGAKIIDFPSANKSRQRKKNLSNTPTGASTNPKNFDLNKNLSMNLI